MVVFQHALIVVEECLLALGADHETIVETWVTEIVSQAGDDETRDLKLIEDCGESIIQEEGS